MSPRTKARPVVLPKLEWQPSPNHSERRSGVHLVVVHRPVGEYHGAVRWLCDPRAEASAHVIMAPGGEEAIQLVAWDRKAWACMAFNSVSDNLEIADEVWDGRDPWGFKVAARIVAYRLHKRGLPAHWVRDLAHGRGFTRHVDLGAPGGGHTDPTEDMRLWRKFVKAVQTEHERGNFRDHWGKGD